MFSKSLGAAVVVTIIAALPLYFVTTTVAPLPLTEATILLVLLFLACLASAWLDSRLQRRSSRRGGDKRQRRRPRSSKGRTGREQGQVKWFNAAKGFGFITRDNGEDVFVHFRGIRGRGRRVLRDGQRVEFSVSETPKGLQAEDVSVAE